MGGSTKNQTQTTQTEIPAFLKPYLTNQANTGNNALTSLSSQLNGAGSEQLVSPFNQNQINGQNMAIQQATDPNGAINTAQNLAGDFARGDWIAQNSAGTTNAINAGMNAPNLPGVSTAQLQSFADNPYQLSQPAQSALDNSANGSYMYGNPAFDEAVQASMRAARPSILSGFAQGGSGAIKGGLAQTAMQQAASDSFARLYGDERNRQIQSAGQLGSFGLQGQGLAQNAASGVVDANLNMRGQDIQQQQMRNQMAMGMGDLLAGERNRQLQATSMLPGIGLMGSEVMQNVGNTQQAQSQNELTAPINAQMMLMNAASGGPNMNGLLGQSQTTPYTKNTGAGILGGAMTGAQLGSMFGPMGTGIGAVGGGLLGLF